MWAAAFGHTNVVEALLDAGTGRTSLRIEDSVRDDEEGDEPSRQMRNALHEACAAGHARAAAVLIKDGAHIDQETDLSESALMLACQFGHQSCVRLLLDADADLSKRDAHHRTCIMLACRGGHTSCVAELCARPAARLVVDLRNNEGTCALTFACRDGHEGACSALLRARAFPDRRDEEGKTPLVWAANNGHPAVVRQLLNAGATPSVLEPTCSLALPKAATSKAAELFDSPRVADYQEVAEILSAAAATIRENPYTSVSFGAGMFKGDEHLTTWLESQGLDVSAWGTGSAKTVGHLYKEIEGAESVLSFDIDGVLRLLAVAKVRIFLPGRPELVLHELSQIFPDGRERKRNLLLSEKMKAGEDPTEAAYRGILEELETVLVESSEIDMVGDSLVKKQERNTSPSFPGLMVVYDLYTIDAVVDGLPEGPFTTLEDKGGGKVLTLNWGWKAVDVGARAFDDAAALGEWLSNRGVDISQWGQGAAKPVDSLHHELEEGECVLVVEPATEDTPAKVLRRTSVAKVRVCRTEADGTQVVLYEAKQTFPDGRTRNRNQILSEKMKAGEDPVDASRRGVLEELGDLITDDSQVVIHADTLKVHTENTPSKSYPTLDSEYELHTVEATVLNLPTESFETQEFKDSQKKKLKHTIGWEWRKE